MDSSEAKAPAAPQVITISEEELYYRELINQKDRQLAQANAEVADLRARRTVLEIKVQNLNDENATLKTAAAKQATAEIKKAIAEKLHDSVIKKAADAVGDSAAAAIQALNGQAQTPHA